MNKQSFLVLGCCMLAALILSASSCKKDPKPRNPISVSGKLGEHQYNCAFTVNGLDNPCSLVFDNMGKLRITVTGNGTPQFSQTVTYEKSTWPTPTNYTAQNGTLTNNSHQIATNGCVDFEVPSGEGGKITASFKEGQGIGNGGCSGPGAGLCFRWIKIIDFASGQFEASSCGSNQPVFIIDDVDPGGFQGNCN